MCVCVCWGGLCLNGLCIRIFVYMHVCMSMHIYVYICIFMYLYSRRPASPTNQKQYPSPLLLPPPPTPSLPPSLSPLPLSSLPTPPYTSPSLNLFQSVDSETTVVTDLTELPSLSESNVTHTVVISPYVADERCVCVGVCVYMFICSCMFICNCLLPTLS